MRRPDEDEFIAGDDPGGAADNGSTTRYNHPVMEKIPSDADPLPPVSGWLQDGFHWFLRGYLRRHFDAVAVCRDGAVDAAALAGQPLVMFTNHPSWWDPIVAHFLNEQIFGGRQFRAPIDAAALEQYAVFKKLGFFGIEAGSRRGAVDFLRRGAAVLRSPDDVLWMTPEGRFADVRDHDAVLMPGLAHVCTRVGRGHAVAMALEYPFWTERLPMAIVRFSLPIPLRDFSDKAVLLDQMTATLRRTQSALADVAIRRDRAALDNVLVGRTGGGFVYDSFRRLKSLLGGKSFDPRHQSQTS